MFKKIKDYLFFIIILVFVTSPFTIFFGLIAWDGNKEISIYDYNEIEKINNNVLYIELHPQILNALEDNKISQFEFHRIMSHKKRIDNVESEKILNEIRNESKLKIKEKIKQIKEKKWL